MEKKYAIVFPGQGSQFVGMGNKLLESSPTARNVFSLVADVTGIPIKEICASGPPEKLALTLYSQIAIFTMQAALCDLFKHRMPLQPTLLAGHSLGEYAALYFAEVFPRLQEAVELVHARARYHQEAANEGNGAMMALVGATLDTVATTCQEVTRQNFIAEVANINAEKQIVISGHLEALQKVAELVGKTEKSRAILLPVNAPCHSSLMETAAGKLDKDLEKLSLKDPAFPVLANYCPSVLHKKENTKEFLVRHLTSPVQWNTCSQMIVAAGVNTVVEIGAKSVLLPLIKKMAPQLDGIFVDDLDSLEKTVVRLSANP
ncbi:MAG: ACP S-malonyltransferase [Deltaproteobacteria bacterium]|nr:ACP S-malonyltransferase [Deltaproteobacteria bacterium]